MARLIYIMGPSGCGKDALMDEARRKLPPEAPVIFAHRYITRPANSGGENHVALTMAEFALRQHKGLFALSWTSHGFSYGIGREIDFWLEQGLTVVMNGSRQAMLPSLQSYPSMLPVLITVPEEVLRARLEARGREDKAGVEARLERRHLAVPELPDLIRFDNSGPLSASGQALADLIVTAASNHGI